MNVFLTCDVKFDLSVQSKSSCKNIKHELIERTPADPHDFLDRSIKSLKISENCTFLLTWQD